MFCSVSAKLLLLTPVCLHTALQANKLLEGRGGSNSETMDIWICSLRHFYVLKTRDKLEKYLMVKNFKIFRTI